MSEEADMRRVRVAELKDKLSECLGRVRAGEEIVVCNRNTPIARLVPIAPEDDLGEEERKLVAAGQLTPGGTAIPDSFFTMPAPPVSLKRILAAIDAERRDD